MRGQKIFDPGKTDPVVLYDFSVRLEACAACCLDVESELYWEFQRLLASAFEALPGVVVIDLRDLDEVIEE